MADLFFHNCMNLLQVNLLYGAKNLGDTADLKLNQFGVLSHKIYLDLNLGTCLMPCFLNFDF